MNDTSHFNEGLTPSCIRLNLNELKLQNHNTKVPIRGMLFFHYLTRTQLLVHNEIANIRCQQFDRG